VKIVAYKMLPSGAWRYFGTAGCSSYDGKQFKTCKEFKKRLNEMYPNENFKVKKEGNR
jgi:hypothetical protein